MNGSSTALVAPTEEALSTSVLLGSSVGSISSPRKAKSEISKVYKHAEALFVTRRFSEALAAIEPLITVPRSQNGTHDNEETANVAPIARANQKSRIKVWNFYLTLLNTIAELGPEEGKKEFGGREWSSLVAKAQDGSIWDDVVHIGYGGMEGNVDTDVVFNLASLLLAQSTAQAGNQRHLETYLSASSKPSLDLTDRFRGANGSHALRSGQTSQTGGTDTPRDLNARIRIIELYALHVLPSTGEWNYAREFINMSEVLDEEIREEFLQTLRTLEDEDNKGQDQIEDALPQQDELTEQDPLPAEETRPDSLEAVRQESSATHHRSDSEQDYGIDQPRAPLDAPTFQPAPPKATSKPVQSKPSRSPPTRSARKTTNTSIYNRSAAVLSALQQLVRSMTEQASQNPMSLLRFVLFLMGLIVAFSRRDVKDRLGRLTGAGWDKVKRTVGMGVKVSYI